MKTLIVGLLIAGMLSGVSGVAGARELQYPQPASTPTNDSGGSNVLPLVAIAGAVVTTGLILFKIHKIKQARAARFSIYVMAKGAK